MAEYKDTDAILKEIYRRANCSNIGETTIPYLDWKEVISIINDAPTADVVEVKHGYWEIVKGSNGKEKMVCTNCRHQQDLHSTFTYCHNCGTLIGGRVIYNG